MGWTRPFHAQPSSQGDHPWLANSIRISGLGSRVRNPLPSSWLLTPQSPLIAAPKFGVARRGPIF